MKNSKRPHVAFWDNISRKMCDNLNWNVCVEAVEDVNNGFAKPDADYFRCFEMINKYKTKENYLDRHRKAK